MKRTRTVRPKIAKLGVLSILITVLISPSTRSADSFQLKPSDHKRCLPVLRKGLHGDEFWPSMHAAESLYKVGWQGSGSASAGEALVDAFDDSDDVRLRLMAAAALAKHGNAEVRTKAFRFLRETAKHKPDPDVFRIAVWILARIGDNSDLERIRSREQDCRNHPLAVAFIQHALAALGDAEARSQLIKNLKATDPAIPTYAAVFAGESGIQRAGPLLIRQLDDHNADARIRAAQALIVLSQSKSL